MQYGYEDFRRDPEERLRRQEELRRQWIAKGMTWWFEDPPPGWDPVAQLKRAGFAAPT